MKLDSVVYDVDNLTYSLTEQLQLDSPTFKAMYPSETATSMINVMAGYGSMLQYMVVSAIANCYTDSAFSPSGIYQLAETLGNKLHGNVAAKLTCQLTRTTCRGVRSIIPANSLFEVEGVQFFNPSPISFASAVNTVKDVLLVQGVVNTLEYNSSGVADEKIYFGNDFKNYVAPTHIKRKRDHIIIDDDKYVRSLYLISWANVLRDSFVSTLTDISNRMLLSIDIIPVPVDEADRLLRSKSDSADSKIQDWKERQKDITAVPPAQRLNEQAACREWDDDIHNNDERMLTACITMVIIADSKEELDKILNIYAKKLEEIIYG